MAAHGLLLLFALQILHGFAQDGCAIGGRDEDAALLQIGATIRGHATCEPAFRMNVVTFDKYDTTGFKEFMFNKISPEAAKHTEVMFRCGDGQKCFEYQKFHTAADKEEFSKMNWMGDQKGEWLTKFVESGTSMEQHDIDESTFNAAIQGGRCVDVKGGTQFVFQKNTITFDPEDNTGFDDFMFDNISPEAGKHMEAMVRCPAGAKKFVEYHKFKSAADRDAFNKLEWMGDNKGDWLAKLVESGTVKKAAVIDEGAFNAGVAADGCVDVKGAKGDKLVSKDGDLLGAVKDVEALTKDIEDKYAATPEKNMDGAHDLLNGIYDTQQSTPP